MCPASPSEIPWSKKPCCILLSSFGARLGLTSLLQTCYSIANPFQKVKKDCESKNQPSNPHEDVACTSIHADPGCPCRGCGCKHGPLKGICQPTPLKNAGAGDCPDAKTKTEFPNCTSSSGQLLCSLPKHLHYSNLININMILSKLLTSSITPLPKSGSFMSCGCRRLLRGKNFWGMICRGGAATRSIEATGCRALPCFP